MSSPRPLLVAKVTTAAEALSESARCLANANEDRAAGKLKAADTWDRHAQYWLDLHVRLSGDGEKRSPSLTPVQRSALARLASTANGSACVGRGCEFKCNRITARSLEEVGLVRIEGNTFALDQPFVLVITDSGRVLAATLGGQ